MILKSFFSILAILLANSGLCQQIPVGSCGIIYIYDAAGNRTKRVYFCNNGVNPYPQSKKVIPVENPGEPDDNGELSFQEIDALYPNPTTGKFFVTFSKAIDNATISLLDAQGKTIRQIVGKGYRVEFDLSSNPAGMYFVRIEENGRILTKKVVKQ